MNCFTFVKTIPWSNSMNCVLVSMRLYQSLADNYTSLVLYICILNKNQGTQLLLNS